MNLWRAKIILCLLAPLVSAVVSAETNRAEQLKAYMESAGASLGALQVAALAQIREDDKRYLAMTYYLRAGNTISLRWSWTAVQIKTYHESAAHAAALADIDKISRTFATSNPGYVLYANTQVRSLEEQLRRWQIVSSIGVAAQQLRSDALAQLAQFPYATVPDGVSSKRFLAFLLAWRASPMPTLAAPGLSLHGQGRAYDFQIRDLHGRTIASTDTTTIREIWDGQGWTGKLSTAVHAASENFVGPPATPREPWHYEYRAVVE